MIHRDEGIIGAVSMIRLTEIDDRTQCDQMAVFFQYLAIENNENLPKSIKYLPK